MKLYRGVLVVAMMVGATVAAGCKSHDDGSDAPGQPAAQSPAPGTGDDPSGPRRGRRHHGPRHGGFGGGHAHWRDHGGQDSPDQR